MPERRPVSIVARVRVPSADPTALVDLARRLDEVGATALIVDDSPAAPVEAFTLLAALATATTRLGLIAATPVDDHEPYPLARRTATLDHLSHGRSGWLPSAGEPDRGAELIEVVVGLWDSVADDAVVADRVTGHYLHADRRLALDHRGQHFRVDGPLNLSRPPQGRPVLVVSAGTPATSTPAGDLAARRADIVVLDSAGGLGEWDAAIASAGRYPADVRFWLATGPLPGSREVARGPGLPAHAELGGLADPAVDGLVIDVDTDEPDASLEAIGTLVAARRGSAPSGDYRAGTTLRERLRLPRPTVLRGRHA